MGAELIKGTLGRIRFASEDGEWAVAEVETAKGSVIVVGNLLQTKPGEDVVVTGQWQNNAKFGRQFAIESIKTVAPTTIEGIRKYLCSGLVEGIGPVLADRIIEKFGENTIDIIDADPSRIREVEGIGKKRAETITQSWEEQRSVRNVMVFLQSHGITPAYATRVWKAYGHDAIRVIQENPYKLSEDVFGIGFATADSIASHAGIKEDHPARVRAAILHVLREAQGQGHVFLPLAELKTRAAQLLSLPEDAVVQGIDALRESQRIMVDTLDFAGERVAAVYRTGAWRAEAGAAEGLRRLLGVERVFQACSVEHHVRTVEDRLGVRLAMQQKEAVSAAFEHKLVVITGGPGTGKTTIIRAICEIAQGQEMRVALAAPTGRAARRMSQATERDALTVHRLLEYNPNEGGFQHNSERPLEADILILDESSMVDIYLLYAIVDALLPRAVLVLVGDIDQLPSVGPGTVLADIIESGAARVVRLTEIFRQAENSNIVANAYRINRGEMPQDAPRIEGKLSDFYTVNARSATHAQELILELVSQRIPSAFGLDPFEDIQVLAPMHRGEIGCETLNVALQKALVVERGERGVERGGVKWLVGDKVMQTRNNYERGVVNGDVGRIKSVEAAQKKLNVVFEDREVTYAFNELDELTHAFAITVHKSQGSEYPVVVMPVMTQHFVMLKRNLLYTAVTRARQLVVLVGTSRAVSIAVSQADTGVRFSGLAHRLRS